MVYALDRYLEKIEKTNKLYANMLSNTLICRVITKYKFQFRKVYVIKCIFAKIKLFARRGMHILMRPLQIHLCVVNKKKPNKKKTMLSYILLVILLANEGRSNNLRAKRKTR